MKKTLQIFIIFFITLSVNAQQSASIDFFENSGYDKVLISNYRIKDKTFSPPENSKLIFLDTLNTKKEPVKTNIVKSSYVKINERELTKKEIKRLMNKLYEKLIPIYSMDNNENIRINFYKGEVLFQKIIISSSSGNIKIKKENCKNKIIDGNKLNPCIYLGKMTPRLERYINCLLNKK